MPVRFGPLGLNPTLTITNFGTDSNVFNDPVNPQSDFTMTVTPRVQAKLRTGRTVLSGTLATGLNYFRTFSDERSVDYSTDVRADADLGRFQPYASASRLDTHDRLNAELDIRAPRIQTDVGGGARLRLTARTGVVAGFRHSTLKFDEASIFDGVALSQTLDSGIDIVEGGLEFYLTPLTTLSVVASGQQDRFERSPERDADTLRIMPSVRFESPAIIEGTFGVGYRRFDGLDPALPDFAGLVFKGTLAHTFAERTRVELHLSRDVQYSFEELEPYYLMTGFRVTLSQVVRESIDVRGAVGRERLDYRAEESPTKDARRDRADVFSAGAGYRFQSNMRIGVDVEYARRASDRADRTYDRTRVLGSFSYGF